jgi:isocitrate lyase
MLAYNCSPSFNWERNLSKEQIATFQQELGKMGYKFQFVTLAGADCTRCLSCWPDRLVSCAGLVCRLPG